MMATVAMRYSALILFAAMLCGCSADRSRQPFVSLAEEFVYTTLAWSPVSATQVGLHKHGELRLDAILDDFSPNAIEQQRNWLNDIRLRLLRAADLQTLSAEDRADFDIIQDQIALSLHEINTVQSYRHNPTIYVELIGNGLYAPSVLEYAPKAERCRHIVSRMRGVSALLAQARRNLTDSPEIWNEVAQDENDGNIGLVESTLREACSSEVGAADYDAAAKPAVEALRGFSTWLREDLSQRRSNWRLGAEKYAAKFRYALATDATPDHVLAAAEQDMRDTRRQMLALARTMPGAETSGDEHEVIAGALSKVAANHATRETYFEAARRDLAEVRAFVKDKDLLTLPPRDNLQVIETPEFMRGIYSVGGFNSAPAFEPHLGAFYWLTPIPATWPAARVESKLREYNTFGLKLLTIHEAMPGHYVQLEYANDVQPPLRRILRSVFGNGPYVEGWAVYATEAMLDSGYLNNDPGLRLTFLKQQLRVFANTVLDVRLHTKGMTDSQAMELMLEGAFQENEEAKGKLQRAKLSSVQLPTYYVGWRDWHRVRERYREAHSGMVNLKEFHERALREGALPLPVLSRLIAGKAL